MSKLINTGQKTFFNLNIYKKTYLLKKEKREIEIILESDIKKLSIYEYWSKKSNGSTILKLNDDSGIYLSDWKKFCTLYKKESNNASN